MRKFIVSDLHGCGEVYDSIMGYLENVSLVDDVELYINGDLIDRGLDGYRMLEDIFLRINGKGNIKIHYLGGNHELMMYQALKKRKPNKSVSPWSNWILNGGCFVEGVIDAMDNGEEIFAEFKKFIGSLKIYHKFDEIIDGNRLLLVHAQAPKEIMDDCSMRISDNNKKVFDAVWTREKKIRDPLMVKIEEVIGYNRIGKDGYLTIIGHTPVLDNKGFIYNSRNNTINIDGGCAGYALGQFEYDKVPLVEVLDDSLCLIIFNHNNEIVDGYYFDGEVRKIGEEELGAKRVFLDHSYDNREEAKKELIKEINEV